MHLGVAFPALWRRLRRLDNGHGGSPVAYAASIGSIQNFFGYLAAASAPTITGFIAARTGSFQPALLFGALVALLGAIVHLVLVGKPLSLPEDSLSGRAE